MWFLWKFIVKFELKDLIIFSRMSFDEKMLKIIMVCEFALSILEYESHMTDGSFG